MAAADESETPRPRILLISLDQADGKETIITRRADYGKAVELPPIDAEDKLVLTFCNGPAAIITGKELVDELGKDVPFKVKINGGLLGAMLVCSSRIVRKQAEAAPAKNGMSQQLLKEFSRTEISVPLVMSLLLVIVVTGLLRERGDYMQVCTEARGGSIIFIALALMLHVAFMIARDFSKPRESAQAKTSDILLDIEDYTIETSAVDEELDPSQHIPKRFVDGCLGDMTEAMRRWRLTLEWR